MKGKRNILTDAALEMSPVIQDARKYFREMFKIKFLHEERREKIDADTNSPPY